MSEHGVHLNDESTLSDLDFADDIGLISEDSIEMQRMIDTIEKLSARFGLKLNHKKCEALTVCHESVTFKVQGENIKNCDEFTYLGSTVTVNGDIGNEITCRIRKATGAFETMKAYWKRKEISMHLKHRVYNAAVRSTLFYACETWPIKVAELNRLQGFKNRCLRKITGLWNASSQQLNSTRHAT